MNKEQEDARRGNPELYHRFWMALTVDSKTQIEKVWSTYEFLKQGVEKPETYDQFVDRYLSEVMTYYAEALSNASDDEHENDEDQVSEVEIFFKEKMDITKYIIYDVLWWIELLGDEPSFDTSTFET